MASKGYKARAREEREYVRWLLGGGNGGGPHAGTLARHDEERLARTRAERAAEAEADLEGGVLG